MTEKPKPYTLKQIRKWAKKRGHYYKYYASTDSINVNIECEDGGEREFWVHNNECAETDQYILSRLITADIADNLITPEEISE